MFRFLRDCMAFLTASCLHEGSCWCLDSDEPSKAFCLSISSTNAEHRIKRINAYICTDIHKLDTISSAKLGLLCSNRLNLFIHVNIADRCMCESCKRRVSAILICIWVPCSPVKSVTVHEALLEAINCSLMSSNCE